MQAPVQAHPLTGVLDNHNERGPLIEIYNSGPASVSLDRLYLSGTYMNLTNWAFPSGHSIGRRDQRRDVGFVPRSNPFVQCVPRAEGCPFCPKNRCGCPRLHTHPLTTVKP